MGILIRLFAIFLLRQFFTRRRARNNPMAERIEALSWSERAKLAMGLTRDRRVPFVARAMLFLPVVYLISPIDFLPDFIPFLGRLDDTLIFSVAVDMLTRFTPAAVLDEHLGRFRTSWTSTSGI